MTPTLLLEEARRTNELLRAIDDELRTIPKQKLCAATWSKLVTQSVMLSAAIATTETLLEALDG